MEERANEEKKLIENDGMLENEDEELNELVYKGNTEKEGENGRPIFETVRVSKKDFSVYELFRKHKKAQLVLEVNFQRNNVWNNRQKCELIESILMGLPLPILYFKQQDNSTYVVVDGKQRLSALFEFLDNRFQLKNLKILQFLNGKYFKDLSEELGVYQSQLEDYQVYSHIILPPTPDKILFDIFDRVNRGGTKLNKQEIRNALYHGKGLDMIKKITESEEFQESTRIEHAKDARMRGAYLLTRFFSFYLLFNKLVYKENRMYKYNGDLDDLIEVTLTQLNHMSDEELNKLKKITIDCLKMSKEMLGRGAFRKYMNESNPINMNIFETTLYFMTLIKGMPLSNEKIYRGLRDIIDSEDYLFYIGDSRDNIRKVNGRFDLMKQFFKEIIDD